MQKTYRGLSIGAWAMLVAAVIGIPFLILAAILILVVGVSPLAITQPGQSPAMLILLGVSGVITLLSGLLFFIGLALYIILPALSPITARIDYASYRTILACFLFASGLAILLQGVYTVGEILVGIAGGPSLARGQLTPTMLLAAMVSTEVSLFFVVWIRIIRPGVISWRDMGFTADQLGGKVVAGIITGIAIFMISGIIEYILSQLGIQQTQIKLYEPIKSAPLPMFVILFLVGAVLAPFVEETFFRGYIFKAVWAQKGLIQAYIASAAIFAVAHGNIEAFVPVFVIGLILAYVFGRTNSVIPTMIGHAVNNGVAFIVLYFAQLS